MTEGQSVYELLVNKIKQRKLGLYGRKIAKVLLRMRRDGFESSAEMLMAFTVAADAFDEMVGDDMCSLGAAFYLMRKNGADEYKEFCDRHMIRCADCHFHDEAGFCTRFREVVEDHRDLDQKDQVPEWGYLEVEPNQFCSWAARRRDDAS